MGVGWVGWGVGVGEWGEGLAPPPPHAQPLAALGAPLNDSIYILLPLAGPGWLWLPLAGFDCLWLPFGD